MELSQVKQVLAIYSSLYRYAFQSMSKPDVELMAQIWQRKLKGYSYEEVMKATDKITTTSKFMPSIAELIEELEKERCPELRTSGLEAWESVLEAIRKYGYYEPGKALQSMSERVKRAVKVIGWTKLCQSTHNEMVWLRKEFMDIYQDKWSQDYEALAIGNSTGLLENKPGELEERVE